MFANQTQRIALAAAASLIGGAFAHAQSLISSPATTIVASSGVGGDAVPGLPGVSFGGSGDFDGPVIDDAGRMWFRARLVGTGVTTNVNDRAYFVGTSRFDLTMVLRGQDAAPGLPGLTLGTPSNNGISSSYRVSPDGQISFTSSLTGTGVTTTNDTALFGGPIGNIQLIAREGDAAPGTVGATMTATFAYSTQGSAMTRTGRVLFTSALANGDTTTANNLGLFTGGAGTLEMVMRKGVDGPGAAGDTLVTNVGAGFFNHMNDSGQIVFDAQLSQTAGNTPAIPGNDRVYYIYTPGNGYQVLVREGDAAPGTGSATIGLVSGGWSLASGSNIFTNDGRVLAHTDLFGGDVIGITNDRALYFFSTSGHTMVMREGDPAPGTDATFNVVNNSNTTCNSTGTVAFMAVVSGGSSTTANDAGLWVGTPGNLQLVAREGDPAPGTVGATLAMNISSAAIMINDRGQVVFPCDTAGGDTVVSVNSSARFLWDPIHGLKLVARGNDLVEVQPTVFDNIFTVTGAVQFSNQDGRALSFNHDGKLVARFNSNLGMPFVAIIDTCPAVVSICSGDGTATDHTTPCPCGNTGAVGNGCAHSFDPSGANLTYSGSSILDTMVLESSFTPSSSFTLFMQHDTAGDQIFHDGVLCAGGTLVRLRGRNAVTGAASFPNSNFANDSMTLAQRGLVIPGSGVRRFYSAFYRNASTTFCPPATANVTNGLQVDW